MGSGLLIVALSDPLQLGWDLLGTAFYEPSISWIPPIAVWTLMLVGVVGGHMVGAWSGYVVASEATRRRRASCAPARGPPCDLMVEP